MNDCTIIRGRFWYCSTVTWNSAIVVYARSLVIAGDAANTSRCRLQLGIGRAAKRSVVAREIAIKPTFVLVYEYTHDRPNCHDALPFRVAQFTNLVTLKRTDRPLTLVFDAEFDNALITDGLRSMAFAIS